MTTRAFRVCPEDVGILLSYRCDCRCKHCLYNSSPAWHADAIPQQELRRALDAITLWPQRPQVHFSGGEPFLYLDLLLQGVRRASELGLPCYAETNAAWCANEAQARELFAALKQAGLNALLISCSPYHAERIAPIRTLRAIRAALDVFGADKGQVKVYHPAYLDIVQQFDVERPTPLARYDQALGAVEAGQILWQNYGVVSGGRAGYKLGHYAPHHPAAEFADENCGWELLYSQHSHLDLYGNFVPGFCTGLSLGDWHRLPQLLADYQAGQYPPLIKLLAECGPYGLFEWAQDRYAYTPLPLGYTGKCHLCVDVRRWLVERGEFTELRPQAFYENF